MSYTGVVREGEVGEVRQECALRFNYSLESLEPSPVLGPVLCSPTRYPTFLNLAVSP